MKKLSMLFAALTLSGCALLSSPVVQQCAIPVARATVLSLEHSDKAADAWMDVLEVTLRESSRANGHTDFQNSHSDISKSLNYQGGF